MLDLTLGIHDIPEDDYHALLPFSRTDLTLIARSPAHYYAARRDPERVEKEPTPALIDGRILHCAILEPDKFDSRFVVVPADAPRKPSSTQRKAKNPSEGSIRSILWWDEFEFQHADKQVITHEKRLKYHKIAVSIRNHPELVGYLQGALIEQTFIAEDPITGVMVRCRPDIVNQLAGFTVAIDIKSAEDARPGPFGRACYKYNYFAQDAFYRDVISWSGWGELDLFLFAAFEKEPPYAMKPYQATAAAVEQARAEYRSALNLAAKCLETDHWPSYNTDIEPVDYPAWARD